jgi:uncharacterized membrane protein YgcG
MIKLIELIPKSQLNFVKQTNLKELEFKTQGSFDAYKKRHKMRPDTKVKIAGKEMTVAAATKKPGFFKKLKTTIFGKPVEMPKPLNAKNPLNNKIIAYNTSTLFPTLDNLKHVTIGQALKNPEKYKHLAKQIQSIIDADPDGKEYKKHIDFREKQKKREIENRKKLKAKKNKNKYIKQSGEESDYDSSDSLTYTADDDSVFGGFGGGSFGGGGAGGKW